MTDSSRGAAETFGRDVPLGFGAVLRGTKREFIYTAYRRVLMREPSAEEVVQWELRLDSPDFDRIAFLAALWSSQERRAARPKEYGLRGIAALSRLERIPLLGRLISGWLVLMTSRARLHVAETAREDLDRKLDDVHARLDGIDGRLADLFAEMARMTAGLGERLERVETRSSSVVTEMGSRIDRLASELSGVASKTESRIDRLASELSSVASKTESRIDRLASEHRDVGRTLSELKIRLTAVQAALRADVASQPRLGKQGVAPEGPLVNARHHDDGFALRLAKTEASKSEPLTDVGSWIARLAFDRFMADLGDAFRGTPEVISARLRGYADLFQELLADPTTGRVVDIGCGRGELLELLRDEGIAATGVETNRILADLGRAKGLDVCEADALAFLGDSEDESLAAVFAIHVVEHMPLSAVLHMVDQALRALRPGGLLVLETPNPENLIVGSCNFYMDPTHQSPLPPPLLAFMVQQRGFASVEIRRLHPAEPPPQFSVDDPLLRGWLFGPQDYAVIARKSAREPERKEEVTVESGRELDSAMD